MDYSNPLQEIDSSVEGESIRTGYCLAKFLREVDTLESKIGDFAPGSTTSSKFLITTGMQIDDSGSPVHILGDSSIALEAGHKFNSKIKAPLAMLKDYIADSGSTDGTELIKKLRELETSRLLITPVKPKMLCTIIVEESDIDSRLMDENTEKTAETTKKKSTTKQSKIDMIKWITNPKTNILECTVITDVLEGTSGKRGKVSIEDYGQKLFLTDIERYVKSGSVEEHRFVQISRHGYIKPVRVTNKMGHSLVIDNVFLYSVMNNKITPIAYWGKNGTLVGGEVFNSIEQTPLYVPFKKSIAYIAQHRRYIAPAGLVEYNEMTIK